MGTLRHEERKVVLWVRDTAENENILVSRLPYPMP